MPTAQRNSSEPGIAAANATPPPAYVSCPPRSFIARAVPAYAAALAAFSGLLGWAGWLLNLPILTRWLPNMPAMSPNTATGCLLAAVALWLSRGVAGDGEPISRVKRSVVFIAAAVVTLLGATKLLEYSLNVDFGFKDLFFRIPADLVSPASPARMAPHTALAFVFIGPALLLSESVAPRRRRVAPWLALGVALIALASLVGHCYGALFLLPRYGQLDRMAISTAVALGAIGLGILCLRPEERPISLLRDRGAAGASLRRLLPATLLLPLLLGWLQRLGADAGLWGPALGSAIVAVVTTVLLAGFIWQSAQIAHAAEQRLHAAQAALESRVQARTAELSAANTELTNTAEERQLAEDALRLSEERHRLAIRAARLGTFYCPMPLSEILWNDQCKEHFWLPPNAEVDFDLFYSILHPDDRAPTRQAIERALADRDVYDVEYRTCAQDGSGRFRWVRAIGRGYYAADTGELTRFDGITVDITDRRLADAELRRSEARFRELVSAGGPIIWRAEPNGSVVPDAPRWEEFTGQPKGAAAGSGWMRAVHPEDLAATENIWRRALAERTPFELEYLLRRHDGVYRHVSVRGAPVRDDRTGEVIEWVGTITDIHERAAARAEREALLHREQNARALAEEANRVKDEFLATLSHELRTPLNAILGWAHLLRADGPEDKETWSAGLEVIERNTRAQVQLIEDLLDVSRIITGKLRLDVRPVDLGDVIRSSLDAVRPAAEARGVRLHPILDPRAGPISGDPDRLQQVIWNLLTNAIKFTPRDGRVQVRLERVNSHVEVSVADTGQGIAPEFLPYLFDRFRQADSSTTRRHGGLGLGLAIVKNLVEMHGGSVLANSPGAGAGTTLTVRLPLLIVHGRAGVGSLSKEAGNHVSEPAAAENDARLAVIAAHAAAKAGPRLDGLRVLVVDDEKDALELVDLLLTRAGATVITARNVTEAFACFASPEDATPSGPDLLISDIGMPGEDGYSLIRRVRALGAERGGALPALALTAHARADDRMRALAAGFDLQAAKPIDPAELIVTVARLAERVRRK